MNLSVLTNLLAEIHGCTFANMDSETEPSHGILKRTTGTRVMLFTNQKSNGYENMIRRRLTEAGKNPNSFALGDLPWGERIPNSPLIRHRDKTYLQYIELQEGVASFFIQGREVAEKDLMLPSKRKNQGLSPDDEVQIRAINIDHILRIALMGEVLVSEAPERAILRLSV